MKIKNVFLSAITSGSMLISQLLNLSISSENDNDKSMYVEFNVNYAKLSSFPHCEELLEKQLFKDQECINHIDEKLNSIMIKDHLDVLFREMSDYLLRLSNNGEYILHFWVDNPIDWIFFINTFFAFKDEAPIIPEYINPYPQDLNTIFQFLFKSDDETIKTENLFPYPNINSSIVKSKYLKTLMNKINTLNK